jgi:hypothetical protein
MKKTIVSKFMMLALAAGIFGIVAHNAYATVNQQAETSTSINNVSPTFSTAVAESWTQAYQGSSHTDARAASSGTYPTNAGTDVTFTATAHDNNGDHYYLAICKTAVIIPAAAGAPSCATDSTWSVSSSTASDSPASTSYITQASDSESNSWYAYVCDGNGAGGSGDPDH